MGDGDLRYTFTCPSCSGSFSIQLDRIPPVRARFRCPHCKQPMDFPSRDEARIYSSLQSATSLAVAPSEPDAGAELVPPPEAETPVEPSRFEVVRPGYEQDIFDRRAIRNLIRTGDVSEQDLLRVDEGQPVPAGDLPYLKSLFNLRKASKALPPRLCRTHTDVVAFYVCNDTGRPLCEDCSSVKKYGGTSVRVCDHCGGPAGDLQQA